MALNKYAQKALGEKYRPRKPVTISDEAYRFLEAHSDKSGLTVDQLADHWISKMGQVATKGYIDDNQ